MIGLTNHIIVTIIRNVAGLSILSRNNQRAITYPPSYNISYSLPTNRASNFQDLYDPSKLHRVINIMNFYNVPSVNFTPFDRLDLVNPLSLNCIPQSGDELVIVYNPLLVLNTQFIVDNISTHILPDKNVLYNVKCR